MSGTYPALGPRSSQWVSMACRFSDKTRNDWEDRAAFVKHEGKYDLLAMDYSVKVWGGEGRVEMTDERLHCWCSSLPGGG